MKAMAHKKGQGSLSGAGCWRRLQAVQQQLLHQLANFQHFASATLLSALQPLWQLANSSATAQHSMAALSGNKYQVRMMPAAAGAHSTPLLLLVYISLQY